MPQIGTEKFVLVEDRGPVRIITLNRPEKRNALNSALTCELIAALEKAANDAEVRALVLCGAGPSFCAGQDLNEMTRHQGGVDVAASLRQTRHLHGLLRQMPQPLVAAVKGAALGGGAALMLGCDMVVAGRSLVFGYPEVPKGVVPGIVVASLVRHVGQKQAFQMISLGTTLSAENARAFGMVNEIVKDDQLQSAAVHYAEELALLPKDVITEVKRLFYHVTEISYEDALDAGHELVRRMRESGS